MAKVLFLTLTLVFLCQALGQRINPKDPVFARIFEEGACRVDDDYSRARGRPKIIEAMEKKKIKLLKHPDECRYEFFVICNKAGEPDSVSKCFPGQVFNETLMQCQQKTTLFPIPENCKDNQFAYPRNCEEAGYFGFVENPDNCSTYIWCTPSGAKYIMPCAENSYYKKELRRCAWPKDGEISAAEVEACKASKKDN